MQTTARHASNDVPKDAAPALVRGDSGDGPAERSGGNGSIPAASAPAPHALVRLIRSGRGRVAAVAPNGASGQRSGRGSCLSRASGNPVHPVIPNGPVVRQGALHEQPVSGGFEDHADRDGQVAVIGVIGQREIGNRARSRGAVSKEERDGAATSRTSGSCISGRPSRSCRASGASGTC